MLYLNISGYNVILGACGLNEVPCPDSGRPSCIPISWICDGEEDCMTGWDENNNCSE